MINAITLTLLLIMTTTVFSQIPASPLKVESKYIGEFFSNHRGGIKKGHSYQGLIDFGIGFSTKDIGLWKNGEFFTLIENTHGGNPSKNYIGDLQVASNIENGDHTYLYELWYKHQIQKLSIKTGLMDLNAHYHVSEVGGFFINSSFGIMPSASLNMPVPIFPITALGLMVDYQFSKKFNFLIGAWDGDPGDFNDNRYNIQWTLNNKDGFLYIAEGYYDYSQNDDQLNTIKIGALYHSGSFEKVTDNEINKRGKLELHLITEHTIINKPSNEKGRLDAFLQIGYLPDNSINEVPLYLGTGISYKGLFSKRASDIIGLGIAYAKINNQLFSPQSQNNPSETTIELSYTIPLAAQITLQPDFQYIINPGMEQNLKNSLISFCRVIIEH